MAAFSLPSWLSRHIGPDRGKAWCRTALASETSLQASVETIVHQLRGAGPADLALVFAAASYASDLPRLLPLLQEKLRASHWIGCLGGQPQTKTPNLDRLAASGVLAGVALCYGLLFAAAPLLERHYGLVLPLTGLSTQDAALLGAIVVAGLFMGSWPAWRAYRNTLSDGLTLRV